MGLIITGTVTGGNKLGRKLGFPTANIAVEKEFAASDGVYRVRAATGGKTYDGMANLGVKPSVSGNGRRFVEVNIFDFEGDLYDTALTVELLDYIRPERRFNSLEELRSRISADKDQVMNIIKSL